MEKLKGKYETVFIVNTELGEEKVQELVAKFKGMIEANGTVDNVDVWGKRKLEYLINDEAEGFYVVINYQSAPEFQAELDRVLKITDGVLRTMIIRK